TNTEVQDLVSRLAQARRCGRSRKTAAHDDDRVLSFVRGIHELHFALIFFPSIFDRTRGTSCVEFDAHLELSWLSCRRLTEEINVDRDREETEAEKGADHAQQGIKG